MVEIVNLRNVKFGLAGDLKIDRSSKWGNPFYMKNEIERDLVCEKYRVYIDREISEGRLDIKELKDVKRLFCWCAPARCHGDYLKELIEKL